MRLRNLAFQQRIDNLPFAVVVLRARTNRLIDLKQLVPLLLEALSGVHPGEVRWVEALDGMALRIHDRS